MPHRLLRQARVVVTALPTWLALFATAAPFIASDAAQVLPDGWARPVAAAVLTAAGVATFAVQTIRRLTPVPAADRGLLPDE